MTPFRGQYDITYHNELALSGDVRLILANGTEMYIANWNGKGITADYENQGSIAIYGQAKEDEVDTGKLTINSKDTAVDLASGTYAQYGGEVRIYSRIDVNGDITINGGNIYVEGLTALHGTITLGWTNETDSIYSDGYSGNVIIVNDKVLKDEDNTPYFGTISTPSELRYKTLSPYIVHIIAISDEITGGTVSADKVANKGDIVTLTVTPNEGYVLKSLTVKDSSNNPITVTNNQFTTLTAITQLISQIQAPFANITGYLPRLYAMTASAERLMEIESFRNDSEKTALDIDTVKAYYSDSFKSFGLKNADFTYYPAVDSIKDLSKDNQPSCMRRMCLW